MNAISEIALPVTCDHAPVSIVPEIEAATAVLVASNARMAACLATIEPMVDALTSRAAAGDTIGASDLAAFRAAVAGFAGQEVYVLAEVAA